MRITTEDIEEAVIKVAIKHYFRPTKVFIDKVSLKELSEYMIKKAVFDNPGELVEPDTLSALMIGHLGSMVEIYEVNTEKRFLEVS